MAESIQDIQDAQNRRLTSVLLTMAQSYYNDAGFLSFFSLGYLEGAGITISDRLAFLTEKEKW